jgi:hypothetical protein
MTTDHDDQDEPGGDGLTDVLQSVARGLYGHPLLLAGFGVVIALVLAAELLDGAFIPAAVTIIVVFVICVAAWLLSRRREMAHAESIGCPGEQVLEIAMDKSRDGEMTDVGNSTGVPAQPGRTSIRMDKSRGGRMKNVGNTNVGTTDADRPGREG